MKIIIIGLFNNNKLNWSTGRCPCSQRLLHRPAYDYYVAPQQPSTGVEKSKLRIIDILKIYYNFSGPHKEG